jgi:hypothetical protein
MSNKVKEPLTVEQIYTKNEKKRKVFAILGSVTWYSFLSLAVLFFGLTADNSFGNLAEIVNLLDENTYTQEELNANYEYLVDKWGELEIADTNSSESSIKYIDVEQALFSDSMSTYSILSLGAFVAAVTFGKITFPLLVRHFRKNNAEMAEMITIKPVSQEMSTLQTEKAPERKEWF